MSNSWRCRASEKAKTSLIDYLKVKNSVTYYTLHASKCKKRTRKTRPFLI